ncbi:MAG: adenylyl-sulfate kinase [Nitrospirae bacterium]|nr:adenylyl-sulfate kinase [Nitrospirota bacterium]
MDIKAIWITGLPGSGKSTVADALNELHPEFVILRMDDLRKVVTPEPSYSEAERDLVYRSIVYLAKRLSELGHHVIIDATGNLRRWRDLARKLIPEYIEVYLKCSLDVCSKREMARVDTHAAPRDIYKKGAEGWPVPGVHVPYEEPVNPEIVIDADQTSIKDAAGIIDRYLKR